MEKESTHHNLSLLWSMGHSFYLPFFVKITFLVMVVVVVVVMVVVGVIVVSVASASSRASRFHVVWKLSWNPFYGGGGGGGQWATHSISILLFLVKSTLDWRPFNFAIFFSLWNEFGHKCGLAVWLALRQMKFHVSAVWLFPRQCGVVN